MTIVKNIIGGVLMTNTGIAHRIDAPSVLVSMPKVDSEFSICDVEPPYEEMVFNTEVPNIASSDKSRFTARFFQNGVGDFYLIGASLSGGEFLLVKSIVIDGAYNYCTTEILWSDYPTGKYMIEFRFSDFSNEPDQTILYHPYNSVPYNENRADGTLLFRFLNKGQFDNPQFVYNSTGSPIEEHYNFRLQGNILGIKPNQNKETFLSSSNTTKMREVFVFNVYEIELHLLPAKVVNRLYPMIIEASFDLFDYNLLRFNQDQTSAYKMIINDPSLTLNSNNSNGLLTIESEDSEKNYKKRFRR